MPCKRDKKKIGCVAFVCMSETMQSKPNPRSAAERVSPTLQGGYSKLLGVCMCVLMSTQKR